MRWAIWAALASMMIGAAGQTAAPAAAKPAPPTVWEKYGTKTVNAELPRWLKLGGEARMRFEDDLGMGYRNGNDDAFLLQRLRLRMEVRPSQWMAFQFEGQDSRVWGYKAQPVPASILNAMDLRQAYLDLGKEGTVLSARVGRQSLVFGEGRLVADPAWSNTGRTFDAVRMTFTKGRFKADAFAASVVKQKNADFDRRTDGDNFHGVYAVVREWTPGSTFEPYAFWRLNRGLKSEFGRTGKLDTKTAGFRWYGRLPARWEYNMEMAGQAGAWSADTMGAWAGHWGLGRTLNNSKWKPKATAEYRYASGDQDPKDGRHGAFDQLYPSAHDKFGLADQLMWSNLKHYRAAYEMTLTKTVTFKSGYNSFFLAEKRDALYAPGGKAVARSVNGTAGSHIGEEIDAQFFWTPNKNQAFNIGYGRIFPGRFLKSTISGVPYNAFFVNVAHVF
jgi:hypothetical protein